MREISKEEIKQKLLYNIYMSHELINNPTAKATTLQNVYGNFEELKLIQKISITISAIQIISYLKDRNFEGIKEEDIKHNYNNIFDSPNTTYKQKDILGLLRNALCHNNTNTYTLFVDDNTNIIIKINMTLKNGTKFIATINESTIKNMLDDLCLSHNLKIGRIIHILNTDNFTKGDLENCVQTIFYLIKDKNITSEKLKKLFNISVKELMKTKRNNIQECQLNDKQQKNINSFLPNLYECLKPYFNDVEKVEKIINPYLHAATCNTIPDGLFKIEWQFFNHIIQLMLLGYRYNISYLEIKKQLVKIAKNEGIMDNNLIDNLLQFNYDKLIAFITNKDYIYSNMMLWVSYILQNEENEIITIGTKDYERNKLRNSAIHGRWHINHETGIVTFYDYKKEYDYNFEEDIQLSDLLNYCYINTYSEPYKKKLS